MMKDEKRRMDGMDFMDSRNGTDFMDVMIGELKRTAKLGYQDGWEYLANLLELTAHKISTATMNADREAEIRKKKLMQMEYLMGYKCAASAGQGSDFPFVQLKRIFHLTAFQCHCVLTALLYQVRVDHKRIFSPERKKQSPPIARLAADSFHEKITLTRIQKELSPEFRALFLEYQPKPSSSPFEIPLHLAESIKRFLIPGDGVLFAEDREASLPSELGAMVSCRKTKNTEIAALISQAYENAPFGSIINVYGRPKSGRLFQIRCGLANRCSRISVISMKDLLPLEAYLWEYKLYEIMRGSLLYDAAVCITDMEAMEQEASEKSLTLIAMLLVFARRHFPCFFLITEKPYRLTREIQRGMPMAHIEIKALTKEEQLVLWKKCFTEEFQEAPEYLQSIVNKYDFNPGEIKEAVKKVRMLSIAKKDGLHIQQSPHIQESLLDQACHSSCEKLRELGTHAVLGTYDWEDLILADSQKEILMHGCNHIHQSHIVYGNWGYEKLLPYGRNLNMLFEGPPGTGKTMAAQIIAKNLGLELYKVDISKTVSKYIGETEENLNKIFNEAERCNAILFIDEMDAFFGKRTEIKDSHDKYANTETSFLLQKLESFRGILLLATNHMENIDEAFIRRIKFIVHFTLPDEDNRKRLWRSMFPAETPLSRDVDFDFLANRFQLSGGVIKNIALKAAFLAAAQQKRVSMRHIFLSLQDELTKQGKVLLDSDFGEYRYLLDT